MGWTDSHLHVFTFGDLSYGVPDPNDFFEVENERKVRLNTLLTEPTQKLHYEYDFGDNWQHEVVPEKILSPDPGVVYPRCVAGKRACPPEDCGGIGGYEELVEALADPNHPSRAMFIEWLGGEFDPEQFDLDEVNAELRRL